MKLFAYALRPYDELLFLQDQAQVQGFSFDYTEQHLDLETVELCAGYDAVSCIIAKVDRSILERLHELGVQALATRSIGFDHIDLQAAHDLGIRVAHAVYPPQGVANFAIMLLLETLRKVKYITNQSTAHNFDLQGKLGRDISSCTVGVIGTGNIGATVIKHLSGFGCTLLAYDPYPKPEVEAYARYVSLDELLAQSDAISLHAPAMPENEHMIDARALACMKPGAVIVNTARGSLIDTDALIEALASGHLGGAGLDALEGEEEILYLDRRHDRWTDARRAQLEAMPHVIVYPHIAFYTAEDVEQMIVSTTSALIAFEQGNSSPFEVSV